MRRSKKNINKEKVISIIVACTILLTLGVGVVSVVNSTKKTPDNNNIVDLNETEAPNVAFKAEEPDTQVESSEDDVADYYNADEIEDIYDEIGTQAEPETVVETPAADIVDVNAQAAKDPVAEYTFSEESKLMWPVKGDIILKYSMDSTILFKTLGVYKCNPAILIAAEQATNVGVAADGVVTDVHQSEETGTTVVVAVGSGYVTTYGQLDGVVVKAGDKVKAGQLLGTVAKPTAYYVEEGSHVYFGLTKDDAPIDPTPFFE